MRRDEQPIHRITRFTRALENEEVTKSIIGIFYDVYNNLRFGLHEELYRKALIIELRRHGHRVLREVQIDVYYRGQRIGFYRADLVVGEKVLVELKATRELQEADFRQTQNYLRLSLLRTGLLLHFGPRPKFHRFYSDIDKPGFEIRIRRSSRPISPAAENCAERESDDAPDD